MNNHATVATWDLLLDLGFVLDAEPQSPFVTRGLIYDFGSFQLRAHRLVSLRAFAEVVLFEGIIATHRTVTEVNFEAPTQLQSREQCIAILAYYLEKPCGSFFHPERGTSWLIEGRQYPHLLPWAIEAAERERELAPYRARPQCVVQRDWAKLALKTLSLYLADMIDETPLVLSFADSVLTMRCGKKIIALAGVGQAWSKRYTMPVGPLRQPIKRFVRDNVEVSIWEGKLRIGDQFFAGIEEVQS